MPVVMTIMTKKAGPHRMGRVMGLLGVPMLVAPILGPILGGWLVDDVSWRWIFFINLPIGFVAFVLAQIVLERDQPQPAHRLDWLGMALLSPGLTAVLLRPRRVNERRFRRDEVVGSDRRRRRADRRGSSGTAGTPRNPLIDIRTFTHTRAGAAAGTSCCSRSPSSDRCC